MLLATSKDWTCGKQQLTATRLHELLIKEGHHLRVRNTGVSLDEE
jgi:hypothetical protein